MDTESNERPAPAPFGTVIGIAPGNVPVYSCDYDSADDDALPTRQSYRSYVDDVYMGHKWQCVEFARRWLYANHGYVFDDIAMAYDIFRLTHVRRIADNELLPLRSFLNGAKRAPAPGCLLIWEEGGDFATTGHVAIVTEVTPTYVRVAEQNVGDRMWPSGQNYAREIPATTTANGEYWLQCSFGDETILGWVIQTDDDAHAERITPPDNRLFNLQIKRIDAAPASGKSWLNVANPDEAAYVEMMGGHKLSREAQDDVHYYCLSETALAELRRATNELHALYLHATDYVLRDDARLERFNLPRELWPRIHQSWDNRRNQMVTGRFDFTLSERGLKVYEYNCDSASCHMETGKVQGKWARYYGCDEGDDPGDKLHERLRDAWRHSDVDGLLHIMKDRDLEETYHALFMQEAMAEAGIATKIINGVAGLRWDNAGNVLDSDGVPIRWVWKTWAWETALDQLRAELAEDSASHVLADDERHAERAAAPRLVDVLLRKRVMVYEPLWTLIPSNKAISPVLWGMFPEYPYLLESAYELTAGLERKGYVAKPIVGRGGANVRIVDRNHQIVATTSGRFGDRDTVYQELCKLPFVGDYNVQVSTFTAAGRYAGACVRVDKSPVINMHSDNMALRVVEDRNVL